MARMALSAAWRMILIGLALVAGASRSACGQEMPSEERVASLVRQLGDDSYTARREASRSLGALGAAGREQLQLAAASDDAEVALRAERLLRRLTANDIWSGSVVRLPEGAVPFARAVESIGRQSGNRFLLDGGASTYHNGPVNGPVQSNGTSAGPRFWQTVDDICRQSGNSVRPSYDPRRIGLSVSNHRLGENPIAYQGALRAELTTARRSFVEQVDYRERASDLSHLFELNIEVMWEEGLRLIAFQRQPKIVVAELPSEKAELSSGKGIQRLECETGDWNVVTRNARQLSATLRLEPPPIAADHLDKLVLRWPMMAVGDMAELTLYDLGQGREWYQDDLSLTIDKLWAEADGTWNVVVHIARDFVPPEPTEVLLHENRVELFDAEGRAFVARNNGGSLIGEVVRKTMTFRPPARDAVPAMLRLTYPRVRDARQIEFTFHNVPLPVARPE